MKPTSYFPIQRLKNPTLPSLACAAFAAFAPQSLVGVEVNTTVDELDVFSGINVSLREAIRDTPPGGTFTLYFRVGDVDEVVARIPDGHEVVKPLERTWYGMKEIWVRDPDGYVVTIGAPEGEPPA